MVIDFIDLKIVGFEDEMTVDSPNDPALRYLYLRLSQTPPPLWQKYFAESRKVARHARWRHIWVDRKYLVVECVPTELETHHLNDLKQDITFANSHFRQYMLHQTRSELQKEQTQSIERDRLREMKSRLKFD
ncbi:MAG TPA: hypothetical protein VGC39_02860 [Candidatus Methylacidiphilales bacterium]